MPRLLFAVALVLAAASTCQSHSVSSGGEDGSVGEGEADARASELWGQITAATNAGDWPQARALLDHVPKEIECKRAARKSRNDELTTTN